MAEEDNEVLDWGNEDDVVSLGDEEERYVLEEPGQALQNGSSGTPAIMSAAVTPPRPASTPAPNDEPSISAPDQKSSCPTSTQTALNESPKPRPSATQQTSHRLTFPPRMTHALPPKPMVTNVPYLPPSHPSIVEATAMASTRTKKSNSAGHISKNGPSQDDSESLPAHWEIRHPRNGVGIYYYNTQTFQSQWTRPSSRTNRAPSDSDPIKPSLNRENPLLPLTHDDRHYRPSDDNKQAANMGRRHEQITEEPNARYGRSHHSSTSARSPQRGRERSRSPTPPPTQTRDSRTHGNQRPAKGRAGIKPNVAQKEFDTADLPGDQDRHWTPAQLAPSTPSIKPRNSRRQLRSQNHITDVLIPESKPAEASQPLHRENTGGYNRDRDRAYPPSEYPSHNISVPRSTSPQNVVQAHYEASVEIQRREPFEDRRRSPDPIGDHNLPHPARHERPSRFDRSAPPSSAIERDNGLPMKPAHDDRPGETRRGGASQQYDRRADQERRYEDSAPQDLYPPYSQSVAPEHPRDSDRLWVPGPNVDRRPSPHSEVSNSSGSRKRAPLPPQDAEYRGHANPKSVVYPDSTTQRSRDVPRSPPYHVRDKADNVVDRSPVPRLYVPQDESQDRGYGEMASSTRSIVPVEYERDYERDRDRGRPKLRLNDQSDVDRGYDISMAQPPPDGSRGGYQERDLPSQPRAMQTSVSASSSAYTPSGVSSGPPLTSRYQDRPSPPHLAMTDNRRDNDSRSAPLTWPERRDERPYLPVDHGHARGVPTSSANSIPIGTRRSFNGGDSSVSEYPSDPLADRFDRPPYGVNELPPRPARSYEGNFPRSYPDPEPLPDARPSYPRPLRGDDPYLPSQLDDREYGRRGDKPENAPRGQKLLPPQSENSARQRSSRLSSTNTGRNPRPDESLSELPPSKTWPASDYDTSPRGHYSNATLPRDVTPPPLSREPSYTSPQWEPPSYHEPPSRIAEYHDSIGYRGVPPQDALVDVDVLPNRQGPVGSGQYGAPGERYRRTEGNFESAGQPVPRGGNRRDHQSHDPDPRRVPVAEVPLEDIERGTNRQKWSQSNVPFDDNQRSERPRMLNERISALPEGRARKQPQGNYQDKKFNGERDTFEPRVSERSNPRQDDYVNHPSKSFEQRLDLPERPPPMARGASLLSRISRGGNNTHPASDISPSQSLRDRVQIPAKRDRDDSVRDSHFMDVSYEADDSELDPTGSRKSRKRRRPRRGGPS